MRVCQKRCVYFLPSGNPAIHLWWTHRLSVTRLPGFWLYTEGRMQAFAGIPPVFTVLNLSVVFVPPFLFGLLNLPFIPENSHHGAAGS
jgi:hypothetical protein